ncbi:ATP-binding protein [Candidatus Nitrospira bockiana]
MDDFEKLGVFYLGRPYDLAKKKAKAGWLLYDSKDLVTHAVCVGMTGSGKTGLCVGLLEEAAIDGIPAIIIDPKGDLGNLLLTFPELRPDDFLPWINEDEARKKGLPPPEYAAQQADLWKKGLAAWGQSGERITRLRESAEFVIYTPGSQAGIPVSILKSFAAPSPELLADAELLRERVSTTVTSLLGLLGREADPIKSREHILLSTIVAHAWEHGRDLDLPALIQHIQQPPVTRVGVLDLESFFPSNDRFALALELNNLLAAPGFGAWMEGEALDIGRLLYTAQGKPRMAIFSIAHLSDSERMFFVALLLNQMLGWVRTQSGTTSLRAILYMDEIFGYFPPVANPPSKGPLLTLLKQARAFGVGVVLATQNPVDLDYKGLANTGTWFIGRLQTERDKARVLDGLEGAAAGGGTTFDRQRMERILAGLGRRVFLLHNIHEDAPEIFETRWTLSYLRGPLTRSQIKDLMRGAPRPTPAGADTAAGDRAGPVQVGAELESAAPAGSRPVLPPDVPQHFIPLRGTRPGGARLVYRPAVLGLAHVRFTDPKKGVDVSEEEAYLTPIQASPAPVAWESAEPIDLTLSELETAPTAGAAFAELPPEAAKGKAYDTWTKELAGWLYRTRTMALWKSTALGLVSRPGESERDFRIRLQQAAHEQRDEAAERLRRKYAPKIASLQDRLRRAEQAVVRETEQQRQSQLQAALSVGATLLGAFLGRKTISSTTIGKAQTAIRGAGRVMKDAKDVDLARENVEALQRQLAELEAQFKAEMDTLTAGLDPLTEPLETVAVRPTKSQITVRLVTLAWTPYWLDEHGRASPAWR